MTVWVLFKVAEPYGGADEFMGAFVTVQAAKANENVEKNVAWIENHGVHYGERTDGGPKEEFVIMPIEVEA